MKKKLHIQPKELVNDFKKFVADNGGVRATSRQLGLSASYISLMINEYSPISEDIAAMIGWKCDPRWIREN